MDFRARELAEWCGRQLQINVPALAMVSGDASFRRYFRLKVGDTCYIAMDAPPDKEDSQSFVDLANAWHGSGVRVPAIKASDLTLGFLLLEDFGDLQLFGYVKQAGAPDIQGVYRQAIDQLVDLQSVTLPSSKALPAYDAALLDREMALFSDWLLARELKLQLSGKEQKLVQDFCVLLREAALAQPQVTVHRDYHSRNLMVLDDMSLGILDFQDAVCGPVSYDLVSLLRDCYVRWPEEWVNGWCREYHQRALQSGLPVPEDFTAFYRDFEWMGMQRHLKASGIFARLALRDGKTAYLDDIPNTLQYLLEAAKSYQETRAFADWLEQRVLPLVNESPQA